MKKVTRLLGVLLLLGSSLVTQAQCNRSNKSFKSGETLKYKVAYKWGALNVTAGYATFSVSKTSYNGKSAYHLLGQGKSTTTFDKYFRVRDRYESYVSTSNLTPYKFVRKVEEGGFKFYDNVTFNRSSNVAKSKQGSFKTKPCVHDVISAIYLARNINFGSMKVGSKTYIDLFLDDKTYNIYVKYLGRETIKTSLGSIKCRKISPQLVAGTVFDEKNTMTIWVTDDANQVPVRVKSAISVGAVVVDLTGYSNLRNSSVL